MGPLGHSAAALLALAGAVPGALLLAARPRARVGLGERLGAPFPPGAVEPGALWVHAASVGEVLAASRLLDRLGRSGRALCATSQTPAGRQVLRRTRPEIPSALAPLDHPWCVASALDRVSPAALVMVENELWPFWLRAAAERGVPVISVSARLSERSLARWQRFGALTRSTIAHLSAVGARPEADAQRFVRLGVDVGRVRVTGDLKLEPLEIAAPADDLLALLGVGPLLVAASTHEGEEGAALEAFAHAEAVGSRGALVLAPRHAERFDAVASAVTAAGRRLQRRSTAGSGPLRPGEVMLLDSMGELSGIFHRACLAFVGGSLVPRGGHNLIEPLQAGCPAVLGPHADNVRHVLELLAPSGAVSRVTDAAALGDAFAAALADPEAARRRGEAGRRALEPARGASERSADLVEATLGGAGQAA
jgi:3-deoxy-D-manno-octulosonic-acid transferase